MKRTRKYLFIPYAAILYAILDGVIVVDTVRAVIKMRGRVLKQRPDSTDRYLFVRIHMYGGRRAIAVHRMVWMAMHKMVVPPEHDIHHKDRNKRNNVGTNLSARDMAKHRAEAAKEFWADFNGYPPEWDELGPDDFVAAMQETTY